MTASEPPPEDRSCAAVSPAAAAWRRFNRDPMARCGLIGIGLMIFPALFAPLLANGRPLLLWNGHLSFPFLRYFFAPDGSEMMVDIVFNYLLLLLPSIFLIRWWCRRKGPRLVLTLLAVVLLALPFCLTQKRLSRIDWRQAVSAMPAGTVAWFAPIPYGPFDQVAAPYLKSTRQYWLGTDQIGRDVLARMIYGARVSLAVGLMATLLEIVIGVAIGLLSGYLGGRFDLLVMRVVEIIICFPTFLLLLILMSLFMDRGFKQSILIVIGVLGLTGWTGLCRLVRGEVLKNRSLPYIQSCISLGLPTWRILIFHLLPNITGPIMVSFTFGVAGAIAAESGLSFLGFGVQAPTASWGELLRQAFDNPFEYWHLTLWPGLALFLTLMVFNFTGEGLRKFFDPRSR